MIIDIRHWVKIGVANIQGLEIQSLWPCTTGVRLNYSSWAILCGPSLDCTANLQSGWLQGVTRTQFLRLNLLARFTVTHSIVVILRSRMKTVNLFGDIFNSFILLNSTSLNRNMKENFYIYNKYLYTLISSHTPLPL